jgi:hypothetical protein
MEHGHNTHVIEQPVTTMTSFTQRCPNTGEMFWAFVVIEEIPERFNFEPEDGPYVSMYCEMCRQAHIVNIKTGKVLGEDEDDPEAVNSG